MEQLTPSLELRRLRTKDTLVQEIYAYLFEMIQSGLFEPGSRLPSEPDLSSKLGVSRLSLREALSSLAADGLITKVRGVGSFVSNLSPGGRLGFEKLTSISSSLIALGKTPGTKTVLIDYEQADEAISQALGVDLGQEVLVLKRLRTVDGQPLCWNLGYMAKETPPDDFSPEDVALSIYTYLEVNRGLAIESAEARIFPAMCDTTLSRLLSVPEGTLINKIIQTHYTAQGQPVIYSIQWFLVGSFNLVINRKR